MKKVSQTTVMRCHAMVSSRQHSCLFMTQLDGVPEVLELPQPGGTPRQHGHRRRRGGLGGAAAAAPRLPAYDGRDADGLIRSGGFILVSEYISNISTWHRIPGKAVTEGAEDGRMIQMIHITSHHITASQSRERERGKEGVDFCFC